MSVSIAPLRLAFRLDESNACKYTQNLGADINVFIYFCT